MQIRERPRRRAEIDVVDRLLHFARDVERLANLRVLELRLLGLK